MKFTVVVPAYNEEQSIAGCLDILLSQSRPVDEIIVVNNNSSDDTEAIAREYALSNEVVRVINEDRQGRVAARNAGFDASTGDVIGRVDADTCPRVNWAETAMAIFENDSTWDVVSGRFYLYDAPNQEKVERQISDRYRAKKSTGQEITNITGGSFAIRRDMWQAAKPFLRNREIHEDYDLAIAVLKARGRIWHSPFLVVDASPRRYLNPPWRNWRYLSGGILTTLDHREWKLLTKEVVIFLPQLISLTASWLALRGWDPEMRRWRVRQLLTPPKKDHS